jgi:hypothetical protein
VEHSVDGDARHKLKQCDSVRRARAKRRAGCAGRGDGEYDRGSNIVVTFQIGRSGSASFTGTVMSWEGGALRMDGKADERFLHLPGPMYLYLAGVPKVPPDASHRTTRQRPKRESWPGS